MEITIGIFWVIILILVINTFLEHLFNWWFREWGEDETIIIPIMLYIFKTAILIGILNELLWN